MLYIICPLHVMKYMALFKTTPIFFKSLKSSFTCFLAYSILLADLTPIPGTRSNIL